VICLTVLALYLIYRLVQRGVDLKVLYLSLTLNLVVTPYLMPYHNIYLAPVQAQLLKENRALGFILFGVTIVDLLLMWLGVGLVTYPLITLLVLIAITIRQLRKSKDSGLQPALEIHD
jgi:ACR3 family arsenite efflux pump ArsB